MSVVLYYDAVQIAGEYVFRGPRELAKIFAGMVPQGDYGGAWDNIQVSRQGTWLGSLGDVRQKYHRWVVEMTAWSAVSGVPFNARQPPGRRVENEEE